MKTPVRFLASFLVSLFISLVPATDASAASDRTVISGKVQSDGKCDGEYIVLLNQGMTFVQQLMVPSGGSFSFDVVDGSYTVAVRNEAQCEARQDIKAPAGKTVKLTLKPTASSRVPAETLATAGCMCFRAPCTPCGQGLMYPPYVYPMQNVWWGYPMVSYPTFFYPGAWAYYGLQGGYYPGRGNIALAKPNLYLTGKTGDRLNVKINLAKSASTTWLSSAPEYNLAGWDVEIGEKGKIRIPAEKTEYPYLYFDLRANDDSLQAKKGFCGTRQEAIEKMSALLTESGFLKNEVTDFEQHWSLKMPPQDVCVFPQTNAELDAISQIEFSVKPKSFTRILFVVAYKSGMAVGRTGKFVSEPVVPWEPTRVPSSEKKKTVFAKEALIAREWGVAFTFDPKTGR